MRILYAAPGKQLVEACGPTRHVLAVTRELARLADVTVAFRTFIDPPPADGARFIALDPEYTPPPDARTSDTAIVGFNVAAHRRYLRTLRRFAADHRDAFDCVLEKAWIGSGALARHFTAHGVPTALMEVAQRRTRLMIGWSPRSMARRLVHRATGRRVARTLRRAAAVVVETDVLRNDLVTRVGVAPGNAGTSSSCRPALTTRDSPPATRSIAALNWACRPTP